MVLPCQPGRDSQTTSYAPKQPTEAGEGCRGHGAGAPVTRFPVPEAGR